MSDLIVGSIVTSYGNLFLSPHASLSLSVCLSFSLCLSLSPLAPSLSPSLSLSLIHFSLTPCLSRSICLSFCLSLSVYPFSPPSLPLCLPLCLSLSVHPSLSLSLSFQYVNQGFRPSQYEHFITKYRVLENHTTQIPVNHILPTPLPFQSRRQTGSVFIHVCSIKLSWADVQMVHMD